MINKKVLCLAAAAIVGVSNVSDASGLDKVYTKHKFSVGFETYLATNIGSLLKADGDMEQVESTWIKAGDGVSRMKNKISRKVTIGYGQNFYYKSSNELFHPFIGYDLHGNIPVGRKAQAELVETSLATLPDDEIGDFSLRYDIYRKLSITECGRFNAKFGTTMNFNKNFILETYGLLGANVAIVKYENVYSAAVRLPADVTVEVRDSAEGKESKINAGLTTGIGVTAVYDMYTIGAEFRYNLNKLNINGRNKSIRSFVIGAEVGIRF